MSHNHPENMATTTCPDCLADGERIKQRGERGFADEDVWNLNTYLAGVIAGGLEVLRHNSHGCPPRLCENGDVDGGMKRWEAILEEMAHGFRKFHDDDDYEMTPALAHSFALLQEWWVDLWD